MSEQANLPPAILLMGPTASGKTDLAMRIADQLPCDIISVDSVMVYKGMDIGTAKPDLETLAKYPHRLIDLNDPGEPYSAADFHDDALAAMHAAVKRDRIPLLVGGTMMYYRALMLGIADLPSADPELRRQIVSQAEESGWPAMHAKLAELDPLAASKIHPNNRQRIQRALEVCMATGKPFSDYWGLQELQGQTDWNRASRQRLPYHALSLAIAPASRESLYRRINQRFDTMLSEGFVAEVEELYQRGDLGIDLPSIRAVGYRQVWHYLAGGFSYEEMRERGQAATRQLAKRQMTWLRSWPALQWLSTEDSKTPEQAMEMIKSQFG